jgi:hypothetical protein
MLGGPNKSWRRIDWMTRKLRYRRSEAPRWNQRGFYVCDSTCVGVQDTATAPQPAHAIAAMPFVTPSLPPGAGVE